MESLGDSSCLQGGYRSAPTWAPSGLAALSQRRSGGCIPGTGSHYHWHIHALLGRCMVTGNHVREHRAGLGENQRGLSMGRDTIEKQVALASMMERRSSS